VPVTEAPPRPTPQSMDELLAENRLLREELARLEAEEARGGRW
jgi:hypothetical protein